jgi:hypothetical protein
VEPSSADKNFSPHVVRKRTAEKESSASGFFGGPAEGPRLAAIWANFFAIN